MAKDQAAVKVDVAPTAVRILIFIKLLLVSTALAAVDC
jgi:hypothetical protein